MDGTQGEEYSLSNSIWSFFHSLIFSLSTYSFSLFAFFTYFPSPSFLLSHFRCHRLFLPSSWSCTVNPGLSHSCSWSVTLPFPSNSSCIFLCLCTSISLVDLCLFIYNTLLLSLFFLCLLLWYPIFRPISIYHFLYYYLGIFESLPESPSPPFTPFSRLKRKAKLILA